MIDRIRRLIDSIRRLFQRREPEEEPLGYYNYNLPYDDEPVVVDTGVEYPETREFIEKIDPDTSITRFTGRDVPEQTHGLPIEPLRRRRRGTKGTP